jgi:hypothetical protein
LRTYMAGKQHWLNVRMKTIGCNQRSWKNSL